MPNIGSATHISHTLNDGLLQPRRLHVVQIEKVQQGRRVPEPDLQFRMPLLEEGIVLFSEAIMINLGLAWRTDPPMPPQPTNPRS